MRRGLRHLRLTCRPVLTQVFELLRPKRPARVRALDRLPLLLEARSRWWRYCAIVELLRLVVWHHYARRGRAGLRTLFSSMHRIRRRSLRALDPHPGTLLLARSSLRLFTDRHPALIRGLVRLILRWRTGSMIPVRI